MYMCVSVHSRVSPLSRAHARDSGDVCIDNLV